MSMKVLKAIIEQLLWECRGKPAYESPYHSGWNNGQIEVYEKLLKLLENREK